MEEAKHTPETVSESEWQEMKGIAILAQQSGFPRIQADPQHVIDLIDQRAALLKAVQDLLNALPSATTHPAIAKARAAIKSATGQ